MTQPLDFTEFTLLIVDDNPTNLGVLFDYLSDYGFEIITARNGEDGLKKAEHIQPHIILLDVMMPGIDGFETCRRLKANPATVEIPVIFMTALVTEDDKVKGFESGAVDYVTKPIQQREVLARLITHLQIQAQAKQLEIQKQELIALNASKDKFFSILAHDLKGPFLALLGNSELLADMGDTFAPQEVKKIGQSLNRATRNVFTLLENLLEWAQLQMGRMVYQPTSLDLQAMIKQTVDLFMPVAQNKGIILRNNTVAMPLVQADRHMVDTIIRNFVNNALKFTPAGGNVTISNHVSGAWVEIQVQDTGVGITPENMAKLFRLDTHHSTIGTSKEKGTGLGLVLCKDMIEKCGGQMKLESEPGRGTMIMFSLPINNSVI